MKTIASIFLLLTPLAAQLPRISNASLQGRPVNGELKADFDGTLAALTGAAWFGYSVP